MTTDRDLLRASADLLHRRAKTRMKAAAALGPFHPKYVHLMRAIADAESVAEQIELKLATTPEEDEAGIVSANVPQPAPPLLASFRKVPAIADLGRAKRGVILDDEHVAHARASAVGR